MGGRMPPDGEGSGMLAHYVSLLLLAFAVSVDGFGVGIAYGLRKIRIPLLSVLIIAGCSGLVIGLSMRAGEWISAMLPPAVAQLIGAVVLIGIGGWALFQYGRNRAGRSAVQPDPAGDDRLPASPVRQRQRTAATVLVLELKRLGLVIQILRTPQAADVDRSGVISASEAVLLGCALSLDAFGAGLGAAMIGLPALLTAIVAAVSSAVFLLGGMHVGFRFAGWRGIQTLSLLPGIVLMAMGIMKLL